MNTAKPSKFQKSLTYSAEKVLAIAARDGAVIAGKSEHRGAVERVSASTIQSLAADGLVTLGLSPDGGVMGRLTEAGIELAKKYGNL